MGGKRTFDRYYCPVGTFGFHPGESGSSFEPPREYLPATVYLGEHKETVFYRSEAWQADDYVQHWRLSAQALLEGHTPVLFCTNYDSKGCSCFIGWPDGERFVFEEWLLRSDDVVRDELRLSLRGGSAKPNVGASHFHVDAADIEALVRKHP